MAVNRKELTKEQRFRIADELAAERLPEIDRRLRAVSCRETIYTKYVKRGIDLLVSSVALILTLPINLVIGILTFFDVGRPIFFTQDRIGKDGKLFKIVKFRNMRNTKDEKGELLPASQRVTKFGKFVRKTSLDELLNFWSVFKGDMSLIGPRPLVPEYYDRWNIYHKSATAVRPGLECPPPPGAASRTWQDQFDNAVWYVENVSFRTDVILIFRLVQFAFDRKSAEARASVSNKGIFMGYSLDGTAINLDQVPDEIIERVISAEDARNTKGET